MLRYLAAMVLVSAAVLGLELALMRIWMITQYHHLSYFAIGTALLGFGAGGTLLSLFRTTALAHYRTIAWLCALGFAVATPAAYLASRVLPLHPLELLWSATSWGWLVALQVLVFVPFLFGGTYIGLLLTAHAARADRWYAANLAGSGLGASAAVGLMFLLEAQALIGCMGLAAWVGGVLSVPRRSAGHVLATIATGAVCAVLSACASAWPPVIDEFKALPGYLRLEGATTVASRHSARGRIDVVASPAIHEVVDLSPLYAGAIPPQMVLSVDAGRGSALTAIETRDDAAFLDWSVPAAAYALGPFDRVLIVGAGGGTDVHLARYHGAARITAVEINPQIVELLRGELADASGRAYVQPGVVPVVAEARGWLESTDQSFDLITIPLLDSFAATSAGLAALNESYLYTTQAIDTALTRLNAGGCLSIVRWIQYPPRDTIKILATAVEVLRRRGVADPSLHIAMVRFQLAANLIVSVDPLGDARVQRFRQFCASRNFQAIWYPGMDSSEAGRFHELSRLNADGTFTGRAAIHEAARCLLFDDARRFYDESLFDVRPATDDRPYFFSFFRWRLLPVLRKLGPFAAGQIEYGYAMLVILLVQSAIVSAVLILLPLRWLKTDAPGGGGRRLATGAYFACLGLAYLFLEMAMIQKLTLFLASPVLSGAVVLSGFLVFSGVGSYLSGRLARPPGQMIVAAVIVVVAVGALYTLVLRAGLSPLGGLPVVARAFVCVIALAPLAAAMGVPFPQGLRLTERGAPAFVPWAWGINGFASVVATSAAVVLAMGFGFTAVVWIALALYALAAVLSRRLTQKKVARKKVSG